MDPWAGARRVDVELPHASYPIFVGSGLLDALPAAFAAAGLPPGPYAIVSDSTVAGLYEESIARALEAGGHRRAVSVHLPPGEATKSLDQLARLYDAFAAAGLDRTTPVLALGGGVVGDITGFAAATFKRGLPFVQIPTTLLAQVDSAVGGKVAVNHPAGKNLIGAFYQPRVVVADMMALRSLPESELVSGLAEVLKYGVLADGEFFEWVHGAAEALRAMKGEALQKAVVRSCEIKAEVVASDELDLGRRAILNFGHTVGHAIESELGYGGIRHGEAVAIGMVVAARIGVALGATPTRVPERIEAALMALGLPTRIPADITPEAIITAVRQDKKIQAGKLRFIIPTRIGAVEIRDDVSEDQIREACR